MLPAGAWPQSNPPLPRTDNQIWMDVTASHALGRTTDLVLSGGTRLGQDASHFVYERFGAGLAFKLGEASRWRKYVTVTPFYTYLAAQPFAGEDRRENRVALDTAVALPLGRWTLGTRHDIERRFIDPRDTTRYRTRLQLEREIRVAHTSFRAFTSDEVYYEWRYHAWTRNRFIIGGGKSLSERLALDIYYVRQNDGFSRPGDLNAVGFTLRTRF